VLGTVLSSVQAEHSYYRQGHSYYAQSAESREAPRVSRKKLIFSMEESPDYAEDSETAESEEPDESFKHSKSTESGGSVVREKNKNNTTISNENSEEEIDDKISESNSDDEPTEA
jgi:hypothetical protein